MLYLNTQLSSCLGCYSAVSNHSSSVSLKKSICFLRLPFSSPLSCNASSFPLVLHLPQMLMCLPLAGQATAPPLWPNSCPKKCPQTSQTAHTATGQLVVTVQGEKSPALRGAVLSLLNTNCNPNSLRIKAWVKYTVHKKEKILCLMPSW